MSISEWINKSLPDVVNRIEQDIIESFHIDTDEGLNISGRNTIFELLDNMLSVLFPGAFSKEKITASELNFYLANILRSTGVGLAKQIKDIFLYHCGTHTCENCDCGSRGEQIAIHLIESLPSIRKTLMTDIQAGLKGDPASYSKEAIVLSYPYLEAVATYRIANLLYKQDVPIIPRIMSERAHSRTGIDINPGATIGSYFFIDHGTGVVIGETCTIGNNVKIYQGVTLGALSPFDKSGEPLKGKKRHPDIEDDVIIYANATILGGNTVVGKGAIIGGNTWITKSVPPGAKVLESRGNRIIN
ncbi:MAG: serine acetyltransferase [Spirochaetes bacterium]|nr:serine acetyltransferase [Spirochaetota bacterium]